MYGALHVVKPVEVGTPFLVNSSAIFTVPFPFKYSVLQESKF